MSFARDGDRWVTNSCAYLATISLTTRARTNAIAWWSNATNSDKMRAASTLALLRSTRSSPKNGGFQITNALGPRGEPSLSTTSIARPVRRWASSFGLRMVAEQQM
jgi:hypothetical protein